MNQSCKCRPGGHVQEKGAGAEERAEAGKVGYVRLQASGHMASSPDRFKHRVVALCCTTLASLPPAPSSLFTADDVSPPLAFEAATSGGAAATPRALPDGSVEVAAHPIFSICELQGSLQSFLPLNGLFEVLFCTTRLPLLRHLRVPLGETGTHARRTWFPFLRRCVCRFTLPSFPPSWFRHARQ